MEKLGYQILVTILIPGGLLVGALLLGVEAYAPSSGVAALLDLLYDKEWLGTGAFLLMATLLGTVHGSLLDMLETITYDNLTAASMGITPDAFWEQWLRYVDSLDHGSNPFIDHMALYFFFEYRTGVALIILGVIGIPARPESVFTVAFILVLAIGLFLIWVARGTHEILAEYRERHFSDQAVKARQEREVCVHCGKPAQSGTSR